jgi:enoyl-[acyl-carrier protein] reductase I
MLLEGKKLVAGADARVDRVRGGAGPQARAEIVLTSFGRAMGLTEKSARRLPEPVDVLEMDANDPSQIEAVSAEVGSRWGRLDGFLHAIAFAPQDALGGNFLHTPWESVGTAIQTSAFSLKSIATGMLPHMREHGGAIVSLDFNARVAWPIYDWMGVAKASLESITRYLARDLGPHAVRVNTLSAGPLRTIAGKGIPGFRRSPTGGAREPRSAGTRPTRARSPTRSSSSCRTCRGGSPARWSTWTAATTPWARHSPSGVAPPSMPRASAA